MNEDRCQACGARKDPDDRQNAEIALANILALMKRPGAVAMLEQVLRHVSGAKSGVLRMIAREEDEAARR